MEALDETLLERVDKLLRWGTGRQVLLSTSGTQVAIGELAARSKGFEQAIRAIARELQKLAAAHERETSS